MLRCSKKVGIVWIRTVAVSINHSDSYSQERHQDLQIMYDMIVIFFAATAALRTTRGSLSVCLSVCLYVCLYVSFSFFAIYSKNLQATHTSKFVIICNIFLRMPLWKKKFQKFCVRGCTALFGHQVQNNFFALIKKIFLQTLVEIIFRYHKNLF